MRLNPLPNAYGCHHPLCMDSTWDHDCPTVPDSRTRCAQCATHHTEAKCPEPAARFSVQLTIRRTVTAKSSADAIAMVAEDLRRGGETLGVESVSAHRTYR